MVPEMTGCLDQTSPDILIDSVLISGALIGNKTPSFRMILDVIMSGACWIMLEISFPESVLISR
jgi:hypothetical protein